jgi:hypothetical protein
MLCHCGAGLQSIASPFCAAVRELIEADAGLLVWTGPGGTRPGFCHETAPAEVKDRFDELFDHSEAVRATSLMNGEGPAIGKMLSHGMQDAFERGTVYRELCLPLNHRYVLDMVVPGQAAYFALNRAGRPFDRHHAKELEPVWPLMLAALDQGSEPILWRSFGLGGAHLIASMDGREMLAIDDEAERILSNDHLLPRHVDKLALPRSAPGFVGLIAASLANRASVELAIPVSDGRLLCKARRTNLLTADGIGSREAVMVGIDQQFSEDVAVIDYLFERPLTGLQRDIAFHAVQGRPRSDCAARFGVSTEALKKHLQVIYRETRVNGWEELGKLKANIATVRAMKAGAGAELIHFE